MPCFPLAGHLWAKRTAIVLAVVLGAAGILPSAEGRIDRILADGWRFTRTEAPSTQASDAWTAIVVPHTWNAEDVLPLPSTGATSVRPTPYRGPGTYARMLDLDPAWKDRRIFLRFEAASLVATVLLNGRILGEHRGGFTAFCIELTGHLDWTKPNELRVLVDNRKVPDVAPLQGDFNVQGGLYRPVHLLITSPVCISPLEQGSSGVFVTQTGLTDERAEVQVRTVLAQPAGGCGGRIETDIVAADGTVVADTSQPFTASDLEHTVRLTIDHPRRWQASQDPYLYSCRVSLRRDQDAGNPSDLMEVPVGLRTVEITDDRGFLLNGKPYQIHGVNRRQDIAGKGWAIRPADDDRDVALMTEMGVTAVRLAHWPQSAYFHALCDRTGLLLWDEVPLVEMTTDSPAFTANAESQMREMVLQLYNHPSVAFWGLFNELKGDFPRNADLLQRIKAVAQGIDRSRPIVAASFKMGNPTNLVADWTCWNKYPGWYHGLAGQLDVGAGMGARELGRRVGISEYGAGGNPAQHTEDETSPVVPKSVFHPEEFQAYNHERNWASIQGHPRVWGTFLWNMFDFTAANRNEGGFTGLNDKGLVSYDRSIRKDAFYFYKANWNPTPMLHLCSKRFSGRLAAQVTVKAYSNTGPATLMVNGGVIGQAVANTVNTLRWSAVALRPGANEVVVRATCATGELEDRAVWTWDPHVPTVPAEATPLPGP